MKSIWLFAAVTPLSSLAMFGFSGAAGQSISPTSPTTFSLAVRPITGPDDAVTAIEVHERLTGGSDGRKVSFKAAISATGVMHIADSITGLSMHDSQGPVPLETRDDPPNISFESAFRHWVTARKTKYPIDVTYRIAAERPDDRGAPVGMKPAGRGIAGGGIGFLLLPEDIASTETRMSWDLSGLPDGSIGVISAGEGEVTVPGPPADMTKQWFLAGPADTFASSPPSGFHGYAIGKAPFDAPAVLAWSGRMYTTIGNWFRYLGLPPYRLFIRSVNGPSFGTGVAGEGRGSSLVSLGDVYWPGQDLTHNQITMAHEMTHQWVGTIDGRGSWFEEGLTVYVSTLLPCRTGLLGRADCVKQLNGAIKSYLTSPARDWSQAKIDASPFTSEDIRTVPYGRGALYFADLEMQLRRKSKGKRGLQDALYPFLASRESGRKIGVSDWEAVLERELGPKAVEEFRQSMLEGKKKIVPPSDALGPCWRRVSLSFSQSNGASTEGFGWIPVEHYAPATCDVQR